MEICKIKIRKRNVVDWSCLMDYFISDTHFNHENILKYERTEFTHIEDHNKFILEILQKTLTQNDTLYHLGDFGTVTNEIVSEWNKIKGKKIIILGNHDKSSSKLKDLFDEIHKEPIFYTKRILLSHESLPVTEETLNVHGHLHGAKLNKPNYFNISFAVNNYKLTNKKEIENIIARIPKISWKFLEEWYAKDYLFVDNKLF